MSELVVGVYRTLAQFLDSNERLRTLRNLVAIVVIFRFSWRTLFVLYDRGIVRLLRDFKGDIVKLFFSFVKRIPAVRSHVDREIGSQLNDVRKHLIPDSDELPHYLELPEKGLPEEELNGLLERIQKLGEVDFRDGKVSGAVYHGGEGISRIASKANDLFMWSNPLHPEVFPGVRRMEAEIISMVVKMFNGGPDACGTTTSGGTESILLAVKSYRDWARKTRWITEPELVVPETAHCAFDKACDYFGIKIIHIPANERTRKVDLTAVRKAITSNTIAIVASAPQFGHGAIDDVQALAAIAKARGVGLHVDSCLGGFLVPFMEKAGFPLAPFDFRVDGVTSISCDTHKYGFAPKGTSVILYASKELRSYQYFVATNWPGGIYACPTIAGSRSGAVIAGCWSVMMHMGEEGYIACTREIVTATRRIAAGIEAIDGIKLMGYPEVSVVGIGSDHIDIYRLFEQLTKRGWNLNSLQYPASFHICVTYANKDSVDEFLSDVAGITKELMKSPGKKAEGAGAIYGMSQAIPDRSLVDRTARGYIDILYEN